jgi:outer membrane protein
VKKIAIAMVAVVALAGVLVVHAQEGARPATAKPAGPAKDGPPSRVGLVDMAEVFQGYKKFTDLKEALDAEIQKSDAEAKLMVENMQKMQQQMAESNFAPGSNEYEQGEKRLLEAKGEFEAFRAATQRKLARRESEMFKVIYADTTSMVRKYAEWANYSVVIRIDRKDLDESTPSAEAIQRMNKQVVYYRADDDITDYVLSALNKQYPGSSGAAAATPIRQTGATAGDAAPVRN